ncbi:hypothetical protein RB595_006645 [Gaeumannomyces hyphopodioides]
MAGTDEFMESRAGEIDPAWRAAPTEKFMQKRRERQASERAREQTKSFKTLVRSFVRSSKKDYIKQFDVDGTFTWKDVQEAVNEGLQRDADKDRFTAHPFLFISRTFQRKSTALQLLLDFIPDSEYTSLICGVLTLVFGAAKRVNNLRERIIKCLESLSDPVQRTEKYMIVYTEDPGVWDAAEALYLGILEAVEAMLHWMDSSAFANGIKSLFQQSSYGKSLEDDIIKKGIEDNVTEFENAVLLALHRNIDSVKRTGEDTNQTVRQIVQMLVDQERVAPPLPLNSVRNYITPVHLHRILGVQKDAHVMDMQMATIDAQKASTPEFNNRAAVLLRDGAFQAWFHSRTSQLLVVNGGMKLYPEQEAASPLTLAACTLSSVLAESRQALPAIYLCGQHNDPDDGLSGPGGMLRCICAQMLQANPDALDCSAFNYEFVEGISAQNIEALNSLFTLMLNTMPGRLVVIVDAVSWLEAGPWVEEFALVVVYWKRLVDYFNTSGGGRVLKFLLLNSGISGLHERLPKECFLDMEDADDYGVYLDDFGHNVGYI